MPTARAPTPKPLEKRGPLTTLRNWFFAGVVVPGYRVFRPMPALAAMWALCLAHLGLELVHGYAWLWLVDAPIATLATWLLRAWR